LKPATNPKGGIFTGMYERIGIVLHWSKLHGEFVWGDRWSQRELVVI
jgi:hypothetical protein